MDNSQAIEKLEKLERLEKLYNQLLEEDNQNIWRWYVNALTHIRWTWPILAIFTNILMVSFKHPVGISLFSFVLFALLIIPNAYGLYILFRRLSFYQQLKEIDELDHY